MTSKQKQKLTVCIVFILVVLVFLLIGALLDVVEQNNQFRETLALCEDVIQGSVDSDKAAIQACEMYEVKIIQLESDLNEAVLRSEEINRLFEKLMCVNKELLAQSRK
jgi:NAD kinase